MKFCMAIAGVPFKVDIIFVSNVQVPTGEINTDAIEKHYLHAK